MPRKKKTAGPSVATTIVTVAIVTAALTAVVVLGKLYDVTFREPEKRPACCPAK